MNKTIKKILMPLLIVAFSFAVIMGVLLVNRTAHADTEYFKMVGGAQIRLGSEKDTENGLRFLAETSSVKAGEKYHMLIVPHWYNDGYDATEDGDYLAYVTALATQYGDTLIDLSCQTFKVEDKTYIQGSITSIKEYNTYENFIATAYRTIYDAEAEKEVIEYATPYTPAEGETAPATNILDVAVDVMDNNLLDGITDENKKAEATTFVTNTINTGISYKIGNDTPVDLTEYSLQLTADPIVTLAKTGEATVTAKVVNSNSEEVTAFAPYIRTSNSAISYDATNNKVTFSSDIAEDIHCNLAFTCYGLATENAPSVQTDIIKDLGAADTFGKAYIESGNSFKPVSTLIGFESVSKGVVTGAGSAEYDINGIRLATTENISNNMFSNASIYYSDYRSAIIMDKALFELAREEGYTNFEVKVAVAAAATKTPNIGLCFYSHKSQGADTEDGAEGALYNDGTNDTFTMRRTGSTSDVQTYTYGTTNGASSGTPMFRKEIWTKTYTYGHTRFNYSTPDLRTADGWMTIKINLNAILQRADMDSVGIQFTAHQATRTIYIAGGNFTKGLIGADMFADYTGDDGSDSYNNSTFTQTNARESSTTFGVGRHVSANATYANFGGCTSEAYVIPEMISATETEPSTLKVVPNKTLPGGGRGAGHGNTKFYFSVLDTNNSFIWDAYDNGYKYVSIDVKGDIASHNASYPVLSIYAGTTHYEGAAVSGLYPQAGRLAINGAGWNNATFVTRNVLGSELNSETYTTIYIDVEKFISTITSSNYNRICFAMDFYQSSDYYLLFQNTQYHTELPA